LPLLVGEQQKTLHISVKGSAPKAGLEYSRLCLNRDQSVGTSDPLINPPWRNALTPSKADKQLSYLESIWKAKSSHCC